MTPFRLTHPRRALHRPRRAFTLIETIATIAILAVIAVIASKIISESSKSFTDSTVRAELHKNLATTMDRLIAEIRQTDADTSGTIKPDINTSFSATALTWNAGGAARSVSFDSGTGIVSLTGSAVSNSTLLSGCTAFTLTYYTKDNATITPAGVVDNIRRIGITITAAQGSISETLRSKVYLRSMMTGSGAP